MLRPISPRRRLAASFIATAGGALLGAGLLTSIAMVRDRVAACVTSGLAWQSFAVAPQASTFAADFDVTPSAASIDGTTGFGPTSATGYTGLATIVRFNVGGTIDVRNGGGYTAATVVRYTAGVTYHVHLDVSVPRHTYSVSVAPPGVAPILIASNYAFRTEQAAATSLGSWSLYSDQGTHTVCNMVVSGQTLPAGTAVLVALQPQSAAIYVGDTMGYQATAVDARGQPLACPLAWTSSNPAAARVVRAATVAGIAAGTATITATCAQSTGNVAGSTTLQISALGVPFGVSRLQFGGTIPLLTGSYSLVLLDSLGRKVGTAALYIFGP